MNRRASWSCALSVAAVGIVWAPVAQAYVGPGSGLSALGALLAMLGAIGFAIVGLIWYPFKRLWRWLRSKLDRDGSGD